MGSIGENSTISTDRSEEAAWLTAMQLAASSVLPMVIRAAVELDLFELIKKADSASASELAAQLPTSNPDAGSMIDRILRLLAAHGLLICCPKMLPDGGVERSYSLSPVGRFFAVNEEGASVAPASHMIQHRVLMETWYHLKDVILEGGIPFNRAHGMSVFEYTAKDPKFNKIFNQTMFVQSTMILKKIVEMYKGFEGLNSLVDVGGGTGVSLKTIISKYPSIKGINFDLPHVVQDAPPYPGVEHIGGDMFDSIPRADAIFLKWICHDWSDAHCQKLLRNCYEALPNNGKVIVAEAIVPDNPNSGVDALQIADSDMIMFTCNPGGKERTEREFLALAKQAGFKDIVKVCHAYNVWIMEFYK